MYNEEVCTYLRKSLMFGERETDGTIKEGGILRKGGKEKITKS